MGVNMIVYQLVNEFKKINEVIAITLAGSCASGRKDKFSDIDINIITDKDISIKERESIAKKFSDLIEINNTFWGLSDEFIIRNSSIQVDISYFEYSWLKQKLKYILEDYNASIGYSTCFWSNVINSIVVYDRDGNFKKFQEKYNIQYPEKLKKNIIEKNYPILKERFSSYYNQIDKAIKRNDIVNINNRISGFLDSYFDIIFAINEFPHPGEKRLISIIEKNCLKIPKDFKKNIDNLLNNNGNIELEILSNISKIINQLEKLLKNEGILNSCVNVYNEDKD